MCGGHGWPGQAVRRLLGLCPIPASTCPLCSRALRTQRERTSNRMRVSRGEQPVTALTVPQSSLQSPRSPSRGPAAPKRRGPRNEPPWSGGVLALCRDVRRTPHDGLVYLSNCLFSDPEDLARGSQAGTKCVSRPDLAGIKLS